MDNWQTYSIEFKGGLISNLSPLQHGTQAPGSARILRNFEPSIEGGYRRILGYQKFSSSVVPYYGAAVVQGSGQTGTTLILADVSSSPAEGSTVTIGSDVYTIAVGGVLYDSFRKELSLTLTTSLVSSPADGTSVLFSNNTTLCTGIAAWDGIAVVARGTDLYKSNGAEYTLINTPSYGVVRVDGSSQSGSSLVVDGLTKTPVIGDTFTIAGIENTYIIISTPTVVSGSSTFSIYPSLSSSPADDALLTFKTTKVQSTLKTRFTKYRLGSTEKIAGVNGYSFPFSYDNTEFKFLTDNSELEAAEHIVWFKNSIFIAKGDSLFFSAPFTDDDFSAASGGGVIAVGGIITGLKVFREQLIIFTEQKIKRLVGNTAADFALQPITENMGCVASDTIQEIGGDIIFLAADGLRLLSATDRIGDFNLASISQVIQNELTGLISESSSFSSVIIRAKSQYRIFGYNSSVSSDATKGVLCTQLVDGNIGWAEIRGIKAYISDSDYYQNEELILFTNNTGYVYSMEKGSSFDGNNIVSSFSTPFIPIGDPRVRKTFYKLYTYINPRGSFNSTFSLKLDFDNKGSIQPSSIIINNIAADIAIFGVGNSVYGIAKYGGKVEKIVDTQVIGSGFSLSLNYESDSTDPSYIFDAATIEFATHDRR